MKCYMHLDREAVGTCSRCGKFICSECAVEVKGKSLCKKCLDYAFDENKGDNDKPMVFMNAGGGGGGSSSSSSSSSSAAAAAAGGRGIPPYPRNSAGVHVVLFLCTAGLGNIIYYFSVKSRQKQWMITYGR